MIYSSNALLRLGQISLFSVLDILYLLICFISLLISVGGRNGRLLLAFGSLIDIGHANSIWLLLLVSASAVCGCICVVLTLCDQIVSNGLPIIFAEAFALKPLHKVSVPNLFVMLCSKFWHLLPRLPITHTRRSRVAITPRILLPTCLTFILLRLFLHPRIGELDLLYYASVSAVLRMHLFRHCQ